MSVISYTIKPKSPWRTPLRSDTLHGLILCVLAEKEGDNAVKQVIEQFIAGSAPFTCSSAVPTGFLPMPCLNPTERDYFQKKYTTDLTQKLQEYKLFLKKSFIPLNVFIKERAHLSLKALFDVYLEDKEAWNIKLFESHQEPHNTISRNSSIGIEGGLFFPNVYFHEKDTSYEIYVDSKDPERFKSYLEHIGKVGFGADSSTGKGLFDVIAEQDVSYLFTENAYAYSLSLGVLSGMDMAKLEGNYKVFTKKGRAWSQKSGISPFKKPFIALNEGAMLKNMPFDCMIKGLHVDSSLVQLCHTLTLSCGVKE